MFTFFVFVLRQFVEFVETLNECWLCNDVWMDILPFFDRPELGLKLALVSPRFSALVDAHFNEAGVPKMFIGHNPVGFPLPNRPLPINIRFNALWIGYIDYSVIKFLRSNRQIWDRTGSNFHLHIRPFLNNDVQPIWDVFVRQIWPVFAPNIRHFDFHDAEQLGYLRRLISPTILTDLNRLNSMDSGGLFPASICDDGPNATAGQALSKCLHIPTTDGQPKRLFWEDFGEPGSTVWVNDFREKFLNDTTSVSYKILFNADPSAPIVPFELVNERTKEKLILVKESEKPWTIQWIMKRCQKGETAAIQWDKNKLDNLHSVNFVLYAGKNTIGPLSP